MFELGVTGLDDHARLEDNVPVVGDSAMKLVLVNLVKGEIGTLNFLFKYMTEKQELISCALEDELEHSYLLKRVSPFLKYSSSDSMAIQFLPVLSAASAVVSDPATLSRIRSLGLEYVLMKYSTRDKGF